MNKFSAPINRLKDYKDKVDFLFAKFLPNSLAKIRKRLPTFCVEPPEDRILLIVVKGAPGVWNDENSNDLVFFNKFNCLINI